MISVVLSDEQAHGLDPHCASFKRTPPPPPPPPPPRRLLLLLLSNLVATPERSFEAHAGAKGWRGGAGQRRDVFAGLSECKY